MRFVVDNQLPPHLSKFLQDAGHDSVHVAMVGMDTADDRALWAWALREKRIVVSKDEDLLFLANRPGDAGRLVWVRLGNCRRGALVEAFSRSLGAVLAALGEGQRIIEVG
jgi:predicted nuclease of predicted toxin-antitoxin system